MHTIFINIYMLNIAKTDKDQKFANEENGCDSSLRPSKQWLNKNAKD